MKRAVVSGIGILVFSIVGLKGINAISEIFSYISVKGLSDRVIKSDKASWSIGIEHRTDNISSITGKRDLNKKLVKEWLLSNGIQSSEITETAPTVDDYRENNKLQYRVVEFIIVKTNNVDLVNELKNNIFKLVETNPELSFCCVDAKFSYSDMNNLRVEMLTEAVKDAEIRAKKIAESSNKQISKLRSISTGRFAVFPDNASFTEEYSWSSDAERALNKRVRIIVHSMYNIK